VSIKQDIEDAKELWKGSSLITKCIIIISLALTTSAVTSLSDVIFKWKGFILDGVNAYRSLVTEPIISFLDRFGLSFSFANVDYLILIGIFVSGCVRVNIGHDGEPGVLGKIMLNVSPKIERIILIILFLVSGAAIYLFTIFFGATNGFLLWMIGVAIFSAFLARGLFFNYMGPIIFAVIVVLLLGAINSGLIRN